jgi:hypothetical protein
MVLRSSGLKEKEPGKLGPSYIALVVTDPPNGAGPDSRATWREVGAVWPHKNGKGFDLVIPRKFVW